MDTHAVEDERLYSLEEFERLPEEEDRVELVRGRLLREPRPGARHGSLIVELSYRLRRYLDGRDVGGVLAVDFGVVLSIDPPIVRGPDLAYVSPERVPAEGMPVGFLRAAPDLAIEIVSPSNTASVLQERVLDFLDAGTKLVWVIDPATRTATVYRTPDDVDLLRADDILSGGDVIPGFRLPLSELFSSSP